HDTVVGFDTKADHFALVAKVTHVDPALTHGVLREAHFNADLEAAMKFNGSQVPPYTLQRHHAIIFQPDAGDLKNEIFLIVDQNGHPGYQPGHDCVFELRSPTHLDALSTADFTVSD